MIELKNVVKTYDQKTIVVDRLNLTIEKGQIIVLIGESGCGKTTSMKMINRLIPMTDGEILFDGKSIMDYSPVELRRKIGYVIQKVGLLPHITIGENIELVPKLLNWDKNKRRLRALELLDLVDLDKSYYHRYAHELSGGQQQRIGVARALATNPDVILMDEPFSALDPMTREQLQRELLKLQDELGKTIVFVTHDMDEALKIGDKIAVMKDGKILQFDTPERILKHPVNDYVENFVGKDRLWKLPEMMYAKDIMNRKVEVIGARRRGLQAFEIMKARGIRRAIVVEKEGKQQQVPLGWIHINQLRSQKAEEKTLQDLVKVEIQAVHETENLPNVLALMKETEANRLVVVDDENKMVGIVTQSSVLDVLADLVSEYDEEGDED
ncbi:betaine/proline/choline family ABC transporter ATP-binding protein [Gottschalkiaceae bacterium SANA]|nr:betaine/proline/choline family ABC transporter ATP-binding protein [Gottschalkiaceae bacterium SANA]